MLISYLFYWWDVYYWALVRLFWGDTFGDLTFWKFICMIDFWAIKRCMDKAPASPATHTYWANAHGRYGISKSGRSNWIHRSNQTSLLRSRLAAVREAGRSSWYWLLFSAHFRKERVDSPATELQHVRLLPPLTDRIACRMNEIAERNRAGFVRYKKRLDRENAISKRYPPISMKIETIFFRHFWITSQSFQVGIFFWVFGDFSRI